MNKTPSCNHYPTRVHPPFLCLFFFFRKESSRMISLFVFKQKVDTFCLVVKKKKRVTFKWCFYLTRKSSRNWLFHAPINILLHPLWILRWPLNTWIMSTPQPLTTSFPAQNLPYTRVPIALFMIERNSDAETWPQIQLCKKREQVPKYSPPTAKYNWWSYLLLLGTFLLIQKFTDAITQSKHASKKYTFKLIATYSKINILPSSWYSWHSPYLSSHGQQVQPTEPWGRIAIPHLAKAGNFTKYNVSSLACSNWFKGIWVEHKISHRPKEEFHWLPMGLGLKEHPNTPRMPFSVKDLEILPEKSFTLALHHSLQIRYTNLYSQRARSLLWRGLS